MHKLILKIDDVIAWVEYRLLMLMMLVLAIILASQVILRYFFNSPLFWAEEVSVQILIACTFMGVSYLLYSKKLVRVDFLLLYFNNRFYCFAEKILQLISFSVLCIICYFSTEWILDPMTRIDISPTTQLPRWYNYGILVASFYCMALHQAVKLLSPVAKVEEAVS